MFVYSHFLNVAQNMSGNIDVYKNGTYVRNLMTNQQIDGPFGKIALDLNNQRLAPFQAYIVNSQTGNLSEFMRIVISTACNNSIGKMVNGRCLYLVVI